MAGVLIIGATGFVGNYVQASFRKAFPDERIVVTGRQGGQHSPFGDALGLDVTDARSVTHAIAEIRPAIVLNLAGIASPSQAARSPGYAWRVHVEGTLAIAHAIMEIVPECTLINVSSGLVYGMTADKSEPLTEEDDLAPIGSYALTKAAADTTLGALARRGLKCIRLRPFSHTGPGQSEQFAVSSFAASLARVELGLAPPVIKVGNLNAKRDYLDVRDVAEAYALIAKRCRMIDPGTIFNVGSGESWSMTEVLDGLISMTAVPVSVEYDASRARVDQITNLCCNSGKLRSTLGWEPRYSFVDTLADVLSFWRLRLADTEVGGPEAPGINGL
jgi:GDP-4-dehydro-6-deoxy-D-mannose reductase